MSKDIRAQMQARPILGDGGHLIELERYGYLAYGSRREKVGTGKGSGQFTPEVTIELPEAFRQIHREFLHAAQPVASNPSAK